MTREEILTAFEDLWRGAALEDRRQFHGRPSGTTYGGTRGTMACAAIIAEQPLITEAAGMMANWRCTVDGCDATHHSVISAMIHLNNDHEWTWDMFAGKFRDALAQGETS